MNGRFQFPVRSIRYPNVSGERTAAIAEPVFMKPLAVPEYLGAISIGIAHIGPITSSAQKNAAPRLSTTTVRSCVRKIGSTHRNDARKPRTTKWHLAFLTSPVRLRIASVTTPPR